MVLGTDDREDEREERLDDDYLELALSGSPPEPDEFLSTRGGGRAELRERLTVLRRAGASPPAFGGSAAR